MAQPLSPNEIRDRALRFAREWEGVTSERAEAQTFWNEFFEVFGRTRRRVARFEERVKQARQRWEKEGKRQGGFIDLFWPGTMIAEHKSAGKNLDTAYKQALDYFDGLQDRDLPRYVVVSDFARIRLYDLEANTDDEFPLKDLPKKIGLFGFISGYTTQRIQEQDPVNIKAAENMGRLHDQLKEGGYAGHQLEVLLVRLLFCLFAEDTTIFDQKDRFRDWIENCTREDGSDLGSQLTGLFQVLNTSDDKRQRNLDERLAAFAYVNGKLFEETLPVAAFNSRMRDALLDCCALDWSRISPAIFGSMFQSVMDAQMRRNLGAHYTSETNILKLIGPLFLDNLKNELQHIGINKAKLTKFHDKLAQLRFLDPACGCGNFLVIAYRELRLLELEILHRLHPEGVTSRALWVVDEVRIDVDQFYGIEIEEFPAQIAQVAMWLMDHQMNMLVSEAFGNYYARLPLKKSPTIVHGNALRIDWNNVVSKDKLSYILGNPPFSGAMVMSDEARDDFGVVFSDLKGAGVLDFVAAWYWLAAKYIQHTSIDVGFVSTNSICQGEQVGLLWRPMLDRFNIHINFAHRTFRWSNEARGKAAVHCMIVGYSTCNNTNKMIYDYDTVNGDPHAITVSNINPYLIDAPDILLENRATPISDIPDMHFGSMPRDGGNLLFTQLEYEQFLISEPKAKPYLHP